MKTLILTTEKWDAIDEAVQTASEVLGLDITVKHINLDVTLDGLYDIKTSLSWLRQVETKSIKAEVVYALGLVHGGKDYDCYGLIVDKEKSLEKHSLYGQHARRDGKSVIEVYARQTDKKYWGYPYTTYNLIHELIHFLDAERGVGGEALHKYLKENDTLDDYIANLKPMKTQLTGVEHKHLNNYWEDNDPKSIILHTTLGDSFDGAFETLKARGLSYNYIIDANGKTYEIVAWDKSAWHSGVKSNPNKRVQNFYGDTNPNKHSVGIAFVRNGQDQLTEEQVNASTQLIKQLGENTREVYTKENIFYHQEITDYKPKEVGLYREQVLEALFGEKEPVEEKVKKVEEKHQKPQEVEQIAVYQLLISILWKTLLRIFGK